MPNISSPGQYYTIEIEPDLLVPMALALRALHRDTLLAGHVFDSRLERLEIDCNRLGRLQWSQDPTTRIDTAEAAAILDCTTRRVCQLSGSLGGVRVAGRWMFQREVVEDFAKEKLYRPVHRKRRSNLTVNIESAR